MLLDALSDGAVYGGLGSGGGTFHTTPTAACKAHDERTAAVFVVLEEVCVDDPWMEGIGRHSSSYNEENIFTMCVILCAWLVFCGISCRIVVIVIHVPNEPVVMGHPLSRYDPSQKSF